MDSGQPVWLPFEKVFDIAYYFAGGLVGQGGEAMASLQFRQDGEHCFQGREELLIALEPVVEPFQAGVGLAAGVEMLAQIFADQ